jgi:exopolysaccharide biosynthesis protein
MIHILFPFFLICMSWVSHAQEYECRKTNQHVIHILTLDPQNYKMKLIKAHEGVFGRETLSSLALRSHAFVAINAGFFEIGHEKDGMPSGTLIIDDKLIGLKFLEHACFVLHKNNPSIQKYTNKINIICGTKILEIRKVNQFVHKNEVVLYSSLWGKNTLTPFKGRKEIVLNKMGKILGIFSHGNTQIPQDGFVLSLPESFKGKILKVGVKLPFDLKQSILSKSPGLSAVMGIPFLITDKKINPEILNKKSSFYNDPQARTAIGLNSKGQVVIIVAEHPYKKQLEDIKLEDIKNFLHKNKDYLVTHYKKLPYELSLNELKQALKKEMTSLEGAKGLTLSELANLMLELDCVSAINLDGGGSSTLWHNYKIKNSTMGDQDESFGQFVLRPISDAIVFVKK